MSETLSQPVTAEQISEVAYGEMLISRLIGSKIIMFGAGASGEILLGVLEKDGARTELMIDKDETGEVCVFEMNVSQ